MIMEDKPKRVRRFDVFDATALKTPEKLANGWLRVSGQIARCGIQEYYDAAGKVRRELREPEEVFAPKSLATFALVPLTNTHPTTLLDSMTARLHQVGSISEPQPHGEWLIADLLVTDAAAVAAIESGRVELSGGYEAEIDETPGVHPVYGPYDCRQKNITGNHLALVDEARAGADARLRLDGADAAMVRCPRSDTQRETERVMPQTIVIAGRKIELSDANASAIQDLVNAEKRRLDTAQRIALKWVMRRMDDPADGDGDDDGDEEEMDDDVDCPQCGGSGKLSKAGEQDAMIGCDMCDGKGTVKASSLGEFGGEVEDDDGADYKEMDDDAKKDVDELEAEQETEKEAAKAHKDWKERRAARVSRKRKDARRRRADAAKRFSSAIKTRVDHASRSRAALETAARKVLGAEAELAKMDAADIKRAVIAKAFPEVKLDGKSADALEERYAMALEHGAAAPAVAHVDHARGTLAMPRIPMPAAAPQSAPSRARVDAARVEREKRMSNVPFDRNKAAEAVTAKSK